MATSDSQNPELKGRYDIFLSFRGLDTRYKFTDHLYRALRREGFRTFRDDDEIERGVDITLELREAIRNSRMSVIVLSENYANSMACLCELQTIVKLCKKSDHFVLPVFYEVEPWVVKEQSKNLVFEEKKVNVEKVKGWSAVLNEVASMAGMVSRKESHRYEADFIEEIVGELKSKLVGNHLRVGDHLVSMDSQTKRVTSWVKDRSTKGTNKIKGLVLDMNVLGNSNKVVFEANTFEKMYNLKLLKLSAVQLSGSYKACPKTLRWLYWRGFPSESFPNDFPLENLVGLDMRHSNLKQVWKGTKVLGSLKILNLSHSPKLLKTPNFSRIPNLEKLVLKACPSLFEVHESIVELQRIESLNLQDCKNLRKLPRNIGMVESLVEIDISGCSNLMGAMEELEKMKSLQVLKASGMDINRVLTVEVVSQASIWPWVPKPRVQMSLTSLPNSLVSLELSNCNLTDDAFPRDLKLSKLQHLFLDENPISSLPNFIKDHTSLQTLVLSGCPKLQQILWPSTWLNTYIFVDDCDALEKITFETGFNFGSLSHLACRKLNHIQGHFKVSPVREVDVELLNSIGFFNLDSMADVEAKLKNSCSGINGAVVPIQILYQDRTFHTFFPGREVPQWFSKKNGGPTISFTATLSPHFSFRGLNLCAVYTFLEDILDDKITFRYYFSFQISSKSLCKKTIFYIPLYGIPEEGEDMVWLSHCFNANLFTEGDEVEVSFSNNQSCIHFKECGVHLLYFEEQGEVFQHVSTLQRSWDPNLSLYEPEAEAPGEYEAGVYTVKYFGDRLATCSNEASSSYKFCTTRSLVKPLNSDA